MKYLRVGIIVAKHDTFHRGIQSSFKTYCQHFYRFADLALDFVKIIFAKIQIGFEFFFCEIEIHIKFAINEKYYSYVTTTER